MIIIYKDIYEGIHKYKDDPLFIKEFENIEPLEFLLDMNEYEFEEYFSTRDSHENYCLSIFVSIFEDEKDDIQWYYENKDKYFKDIICYEAINCQEFDYEMAEILWLYKLCQDGGYGKAYYYLVSEDWLFITTQETLEDKKMVVKYSMEYLINLIKECYGKYEKLARKNRDIFAEINQTIATLNEYSKDEIFIKEVPNVFTIIDNLKDALLSKDEDFAYRAFWQVSFIRNAMELYEKNPADMKFFYDNRDIGKFIKKERNIHDRYSDALWSYFYSFEKSSNFTKCYNYISRNIFYIDKDLDISYNKESIEEFIKWVINEINKR